MLNKINSKNGQALVQFALILGLVAVVAIAVLIQMGKNVTVVGPAISSQLQIATPGK